MERTMTEDRDHPEQAKPDNEQPNTQQQKPPTETNEEKEKDGAPPAQSSPWAFYVVVVAFVCVTVLFLVVWLFPTPKVFTQSSQVIAVLSSTFGIIGTLVGTYFGIKTTGDARDTVERVHANTEKARSGADGGGRKENSG
jgi:quinol-cytochrome oxidoreductase complex cytochrome b subunit